ncbi:histidinol-phosphate transaminase [Leptospira santarosai]|uniref:histidinol-phosphate transaminase n=1 Tax=Leptospira santarosai TaxID=28183 RepID=UPI0024AEBFD3|nr:histidinol-phosphate transaminase [Leptospira santarosai]MDI7174949.1 histidinol-phosphate transaminase [Leptospira santarosai]MDI7194549.1 histidinol-phosphate transaminase [Leptospira santarosai]MDO6399000.1 histidinol-phosphate transaminase [Leptospira santarosai]MDO6404391.1 histidinol-phosphate transaminase [Leptospira santarosai]
MNENWIEISLSDLPLRDDLRSEKPYGAPQIDCEVQLNVNENPYPLSDKVIADIAAAITKEAARLNRYPDREFMELRIKLAAYLSEDSGIQLIPNMIWAANGSNEILQQVMQAFGGPGRTALSFAPTYPMYPEYSRNSLTKWVVGHRNNDFTLDINHVIEEIKRHNASVVFLASPNNPTGTALKLQDIEMILEHTSEGVVVVDEAYGEFRRSGVPSAIRLLPHYPKLIVSRTMSKAFSLAGGRVGYLAANKVIVDALRIVRLPYHLSRVTQATAMAALDNKKELLAKVDEMCIERDELVIWLKSIGLKVPDSDANFVLFGVFADSRAVWQGLLNCGVLIRETELHGWLRVSIGTPEEMDKFRTALLKVLNVAVQ